MYNRVETLKVGLRYITDVLADLRNLLSWCAEFTALKQVGVQPHHFVTSCMQHGSNFGHSVSDNLRPLPKLEDELTPTSISPSIDTTPFRPFALLFPAREWHSCKRLRMPQRNQPHTFHVHPVAGSPVPQAKS